MLMLLLTTGCSDDPETEQLQGSQVRLLSVTRADDPERVTDNNIWLYIMTANGVSTQGSFEHDGDGRINHGLAVKENTQYYMYGFMPTKLGDTDIACSISATADDLGGDYSKGANLTFTGLPVFTDQDICVTVGVRRIKGEQDESYDVAALEGNYGYLSGISTENYLNLLTDHLYAKLELSFNVESKYAELRQIHLKKVMLKSTYGATISPTVSLRNGSGLAGHVDFGQAADPAVETTTTPYEYQEDEAEFYLPKAVAETSPKVLSPVYCAPCIFNGDGTYLSIKSEYDVYDRQNNLIRQGCTASNKVKLTGVTQGVYKKLTLTVAPSYLYMLSEPDLDNPTVEVKSE